MHKVILVKNTTNEQPVRRCLNCGQDISNKRKGAIYCSKLCRMSYLDNGKFRSRYYN